jgi:dihydroxy-acid dehydratase
MRSADWFSGNTKDSYIHRAWMRRGNPDSAFSGTRPQIAILNTASDLTPCNMHLDEVAQSVKNGIHTICLCSHSVKLIFVPQQCYGAI